MPSPKSHYATFRGLRVPLLKSLEADRAELKLLTVMLKALEGVESYYRDEQTALAVDMLKGRIRKEQEEIKEKGELVGILRHHERFFEKFRL